MILKILNTKRGGDLRCHVTMKEVLQVGGQEQAEALEIAVLIQRQMRKHQ